MKIDGRHGLVVEYLPRLATYLPTTYPGGVTPLPRTLTYLPTYPGSPPPPPRVVTYLPTYPGGYQHPTPGVPRA